MKKGSLNFFFLVMESLNLIHSDIGYDLNEENIIESLKFYLLLKMQITQFLKDKIINFLNPNKDRH